MRFSLSDIPKSTLRQEQFIKNAIGNGSQNPRFSKESINQHWTFQRGRGVQTKKNPPGEGYGYFLEQHNVTNLLITKMDMNADCCIFGE